MSHAPKKVVIIATDYFEEIELTSPRDALLRAGATVDIAAPRSGEIKALHRVDAAGSVPVDKILSEVTPQDYDAVVIPGGAFNADQLRVDSGAQEFVRQALAAEKPVAVICHGPWLLISAGVVRGRKLTGYHTIRDDIQNAGGQWVDEPLVQNDSLITSRKPADLPLFNAALLKALNL